MIDRIKAAADCRTIADGRGVTITDRTGDNWRARCWHPESHNNGDRNPSMTIGAGGWRCYGCGAKGSALDLVMDLDGLDLSAAVEALAGELGLDPTPGPRVVRRRPTPPPKRRKVDTTTDPADDPLRAELWGRIWSALYFAPMTEELATWSAERGLDLRAVSLATVRDPTPAAGEILDVLRDYTTGDHRRAGTVDAKGKPWWPIKAVVDVARGRRRSAGGALFPIWTTGTDPEPIGARFRIYRPRKIKAVAQPRGAPLTPLGMDSLARAEAMGEPYSVLICEGETDWLAAMSAMGELGRPSAALAHCVMGKGWEPSWTRRIVSGEHLGRVVVLFDHGRGDTPTGERRAREILRQIIAVKGTAWTADNVKLKLTAEGGDDLADLHKKGELTPLLDGLTPTRQTQSAIAQGAA